MSPFYKPPEEIHSNDGRETHLLNHIIRHPTRILMTDNPSTLLSAIDEYARTQNFLMNVGPHKGAIIAELIARERPRRVLEVGGYVGYSAVLLGDAVLRGALREEEVRYVSLEVNGIFAAVERAMVSIAGLGDVVDVVEGDCRDSILEIATEDKRDGRDGRWDMVFLDHDKESYLNDLKLCEELGIVGPGTIVVADDMYRPGGCGYSEYVRRTPEEKRRVWRRLLEKGVSGGDPELVYESFLVEGMEPTGGLDAIEVSYCVGRAGSC